MQILYRLMVFKLVTYVVHIPSSVQTGVTAYVHARSLEVQSPWQHGIWNTLIHIAKSVETLDTSPTSMWQIQRDETDSPSLDCWALQYKGPRTLQSVKALSIVDQLKLRGRCPWTPRTSKGIATIQLCRSCTVKEHAVRVMVIN